MVCCLQRLLHASALQVWLGPMHQCPQMVTHRLQTLGAKTLQGFQMIQQHPSAVLCLPLTPARLVAGFMHNSIWSADPTETCVDLLRAKNMLACILTKPMQVWLPANPLEKPYLGVKVEPWRMAWTRSRVWSSSQGSWCALTCSYQRLPQRRVSLLSWWQSFCPRPELGGRGSPERPRESR